MSAAPFLDPPYHSVRRVFPSTAGRLACQARPSRLVVQLKPAPGMRHPTSGLLPPFVHLVDTSVIPYCAGSRTRSCTAWRVSSPPPQGPSLGSGLYCPGPSSLNRPHPSRSRAHHDFTAWRLIRNAFAVRERLGDPRAVPGFRCTFRPGMPSSLTPGSSASIISSTSMSTLAFAES